MKDLSPLKKLTQQEQILVCIAVLFDGLDAADVLGTDANNGLALRKIARDLAALAPDVRMPLVGSLLRNLVEKNRGADIRTRDSGSGDRQ